MDEVFGKAFPTTSEDPLSVLLLRLGTAFVLGCTVAAIYRITCGRKGAQSDGLIATLVLLTVLTAMVTLVIGNNVARAFGLVGALSIVRFRTVVDDTRDTAFVIFAVAVGMAAGAGLIIVSLVGIPFASAAAFLYRPRPVSLLPGSEYTLSLRFGVGHDPASRLSAPFERHLERWNLVGTTTARQGAAIDLVYSVRLRREEGVLSLVGELNTVEGVQSVEVRRA